MSSYNLKYVFKANFLDGTTYSQNWEDEPVIADHGSSFTDIVDRLDQIETFELYDVFGDFKCSVNLTNGTFQVQDTPLAVKNPKIKIPPETQFKLIYFRQVSIMFNLPNNEEVGHNVQYNIGWQVTVDGENIQQTIAIE